jgi:hypothetical protein
MRISRRQLIKSLGIAAVASGVRAVADDAGRPRREKGEPCPLALSEFQPKSRLHVSPTRVYRRFQNVSTDIRTCTLISQPVSANRGASPGLPASFSINIRIESYSARMQCRTRRLLFSKDSATSSTKSIIDFWKQKTSASITLRRPLRCRGAGAFMVWDCRRAFCARSTTRMPSGSWELS